MGGKGEAKKATVAARPGAATRAILVNTRESALSMACGSKASWRLHGNRAGLRRVGRGQAGRHGRVPRL